MLLDAPVPDPGPPGPYGTMAWLRATVCRFANGETHARRRALVEALLAELDPGDLRRRAGVPIAGVPLRYRPVAVLAKATGATGDLAALVADVRTVAAAYRPGTHTARA